MTKGNAPSAYRSNESRFDDVTAEARLTALNHVYAAGSRRAPSTTSATATAIHTTWSPVPTVRPWIRPSSAPEIELMGLVNDPLSEARVWTLNGNHPSPKRSLTHAR